jgi:hypothetical protein
MTDEGEAEDSVDDMTAFLDSSPLYPAERLGEGPDSQGPRDSAPHVSLSPDYGGEGDATRAAARLIKHCACCALDHTPAGVAPTGLPADAGVLVAVVAGAASFLP